MKVFAPRDDRITGKNNLDQTALLPVAKHTDTSALRKALVKVFWQQLLRRKPCKCLTSNGRKIVREKMI